MAMSSGEKAWLWLFTGILAWDLTCKPGNTLSEAADLHPRTALALGGIIYAHVANLLPPEKDPIHLGFLVLRRYASRRVAL